MSVTCKSACDMHSDVFSPGGRLTGTKLVHGIEHLKDVRGRLLEDLR